jgi:hypothetical protein
VRSVTPQSLALFSKKMNKLFKEQRAANTPLADYLDIDLEIVNVNSVLDEHWANRLRAGEINERELAEASRKYNNVIKEYQIELKVIK